MMRTIREWLSCHLLLAIPTYLRARAHLSQKLQDSERSYQEEYRELVKFTRNLDGDAISRHQESAAQRLRSIEDKARANLLGITIGIAVLFSGFNMVAGGGSTAMVPGWGRAPLLFLFAVAVCYLLAGGIMALEALRLRPVFLPSLREEVTADVHMRAVQAVWALEQNERTALMRTNALSVSFDGIRNGVICLAVAVVFLAAAIVFSGSDLPTPTPADDAALGGHTDSVQPAVSAPSHSKPPRSSRKGPPSVVEEAAALTKAVDTLPRSAGDTGRLGE